jgi:serine/threonine protein phosphatase PrpC
MIRSHGITDVGCVRTKNEDRIFLGESLGAFIISDGMGGHTHGEMAAELAISTMQHYLESSRDRLDVTWPFGYNFDLSVDANRIATAIQLANRQVWKQAEQAPQYAGMGTTIAAVLVSGSRISVGNVGDTRVYLWQSGVLRQLTIDDTWVNAISGRGGPQIDVPRNLLTQAAGTKDLVEVHTAEAEIGDGDVVLLCSDGLYGLVSDAEIAEALKANKSLSATASDLLRAAKSAGGEDNISVILFGPES